MKFVIVLASLFAVVIAGPTDKTVILRQESDVEPESYKFAVETSDGKSHSEQGHLTNVGTDHAAINVVGEFSFVGDDGEIYKVAYTADENGFIPSAPHLPVAPAHH